MKRIIHRFTDTADLFRAAAQAVIDIGTAAIDARGRFIVALAGGSTPKGVYQLPAKPGFRDQFDWHRVEWFWGDDRTVAADHPDSNFRMADEALLTPLDIQPGRVHRMRGDADDLAAAAVEYAAEIGDVFDGAPPQFDLILLGIGDDGHTASLFPCTAALDAGDAWVVANDVPQLETWRLTMTALLINRAHHVHFLVTGAGKAPRLVEILEGPADPQRLPSQSIAPAGKLEWFIDDAAGSLLAKETRK
jgi:6-phosphogluconolactonase